MHLLDSYEVPLSILLLAGVPQMTRVSAGASVDWEEKRVHCQQQERWTDGYRLQSVKGAENKTVVLGGGIVFVSREVPHHSAVVEM